MALNIDGTYLANKDNKVNTTSINILENKPQDKTASVKGTFAAVVMSKGEKVKVTSYDDLLKEADDVKSQIMQSADNAKIGLKALVKKLSGSEAIKLGEDGYNLTDATEDDMVTIIDKIRIELAMHSDNYRVYGTGVSKEAVMNVTGSFALANQVMNRLEEGGITLSEDELINIKDNLNKLDNLDEISNEAKMYLVMNNIVPTIDGIYSAEATAKSAYNGIGIVSDEEITNMEPQLIRIVQQSDCKNLGKALDNAKNFLKNDVPVTVNNLEKMEELDNLNIKDMKSISGKADLLNKMIDNVASGIDISDIDLTSRFSNLIILQNAIDTVNTAGYKEVDNIVSNNKPLTIENLRNEINKLRNTSWSDEVTDNASKGVTYDEDRQDIVLSLVEKSEGKFITNETNKEYTTLLEARILMSVSARGFLINNAKTIVTTPLDKLNNELIKIYESTQGLTSEEADKVVEVSSAIEEVKEAPVYIFSKLLNSNTASQIISISTVASIGAQIKKQLDIYDKTYESVGTQVRSDLGDSLIKAVNNSADVIMENLNLRKNQANKDAIKILAQNGMEETVDNIEKIKNLNEVLKNLVNNMKPETVLNMIRAGINPMQADINDLNNYLVAANEDASRANEEKFAKFLYKLDKTDGIETEERKMFIGIYQMMNIFTKDAGESVGRLVKQGRSVTMGNLITAYESKKHAGMDARIDDTTGLVSVSGTVNYYMSLFNNNKNFITPNTLKNVDKNHGIINESVDNFIESVQQEYDPDIEAQLDNEYVEALKNAANVSDSVYRDIKMFDMDINIGNVKAVNEFIETGNFALSQIPGLRNIAGISFKKIDKLDDVIEKIGHREDLSNYIEELKDATKESLEAAVEGRLVDINNPRNFSSNMLENATDLAIDNMNYEMLDALRIANRQINYIANLKSRNDYRIPYVTDKGVGMINLSLKSDSNEKGNISIKYESENLGMTTVNINLSDNSARVLLNVSESEYLSKVKEDIATIFEKNYGISQVEYQDTKVINYETYHGSAIPTDRLYSMVRDILKLL